MLVHGGWFRGPGSRVGAGVQGLGRGLCTGRQVAGERSGPLDVCGGQPPTVCGWMGSPSCPVPLPRWLLHAAGMKMGRLTLEPKDVEVLSKEGLKSYWIHRCRGRLFIPYPHPRAGFIRHSNRSSSFPPFGGSGSYAIQKETCGSPQPIPIITEYHWISLGLGYHWVTFRVWTGYPW